MVVNFDKEAEKLGNGGDRDFFKNHVARKAGLTDEQDQFLKIVAHNFVNAFYLIPYKKK